MNRHVQQIVKQMMKKEFILTNHSSFVITVTRNRYTRQSVAMPARTNCVDCKIPRAWMDNGDADESDPNNCVSVSLQSYRIAATTR